MLIMLKSRGKKPFNIITGLYLFDWTTFKFQGRILSNISFIFWAMEFQEKIFLRFTDLYDVQKLVALTAEEAKFCTTKSFSIQDWVSRLRAHYYKIFYLFVGLNFFFLSFAFLQQMIVKSFLQQQQSKRMRFPLKTRDGTIGKTSKTKSYLNF